MDRHSVPNVYSDLESYRSDLRRRSVTEKSLLIKGPLTDLRDVLRIAVAEGRKVLKTQWVNVHPVVYVRGNDYLVVVGCDGASDVGSGKPNGET